MLAHNLAINSTTDIYQLLTVDQIDWNILVTF